MRQIYRPLIIALTASVLLSACEKAPAPTQATVNYSAEQQQLLQQGSQRARSCAACHGPQGISRQALYPSLAGQSAEQLAQAMRDYRDGARKNALMSPQARGLTDADIELLAAFYALLPAPKPKQE
ncbi:c-type cytochrome [Alishewanella longhuensis]